MRILIVGAGGHAKVIADIIQLHGHDIIGFLDDNEKLLRETLNGIKVLDRITAYQEYNFDKLILGTGNNRVRHRLRTQVFHETTDEMWFTAIHPKSIIANSVSIGCGTVVMAGAIINVDTVIQKHVIINTGATIDHDCRVQDYVHIAPGVNLAGGVTIGTGSLIGIGACVIPLRIVGVWATIGAGAAVIDDVADEQTVVGVPARPLLTNETE